MLSESGAPLSAGQTHYLKNVLRLKAGDPIRVFNTERGEFLADLAGKEAIVKEKLREPGSSKRRVHLFAPPLVKDRMDFMIEKAVELGVTDFYPLLTERGQIRKVNEERLLAQMIEAAEQCERMDIPKLHKPVSVAGALDEAKGLIFAGIERFEGSTDAAPRDGRDMNLNVLIGPPGGWSDKEREWLCQKTAALDLGRNILRAETAAIVALAKFL